MGQALYRRYRSKSLAEIVGQEHITKTLTTALQRKAVSHAYLLTGPRGVGKTSVARILAYQINDLPYEGEKTHLDIIEIDAASNRRIDEIRDLRDKVHNAPTSAKYKVYIIDEVHMLTREAFNALLKTLEEPPAHAIFILATTDVHKLPDTIISRTQHFTFKPIAEKSVHDHLKIIAKQEKIHIDNDAIALIARHGGGSFRDSISLLEQAAGLGESVTLTDVQSMLGVPPEESILNLHKTVMHGTPKDIVEILEDLATSGYQADQIASQLIQRLRSSLLDGSADDQTRTVSVLKELLDVPASQNPKSLLEIILLSQVTTRSKVQSEQAPKAAKTSVKDKLVVNDVAKSKKDHTKVNDTTSIEQPDKVTQENMKNSTSHQPPTSSTNNNAYEEVGLDAWQQALAELKKSHSTLYSVARMAEFSRSANKITLLFEFPFHQKRIETAKNKQLINEIVARICGTEIAIECLVSDKKSKAPKQEKPVDNKDSSPLETVSNIFGGGEMLES